MHVFTFLAVRRLYGSRREKTFVSCFFGKYHIVAEETGLSLTLSETLMTGFLASWPILLSSIKSFFNSCRPDKDI